MNDSKQCSRCKQLKLKSEFVKDKSRKDNLYPQCKLCSKNNRQANNLTIKSYRENHREDYRHYNATWRSDNPDKKKLSNALWYEKNKLTIRAKYKIRYYQNPEKYNSGSRTRRARKLNCISEPYTWKDVITLWGTDCHICNQPIDLDAPRSARKKGWENGLHMDHVIALSKGGPDILKNVKPSHALCNLKKNNS